VSPASPKARRPVGISGVGVVSPAGVGSELFWTEAVEGRSSIRTDEFGRYVGRVSADDLSLMSEKVLKSDQWALVQGRYNDLSLSVSHTISMTAMAEALNQAGWSQLNDDDGLILATTTGLVTHWETALANFSEEKKDYDEITGRMKYQSLGCILDHLAISQDFSGPKLLVTSACAAGTQALALACEWLQSGKVKRCLVGGVEVLSQLTLKGFESFQLLSGELARPFDLHRSGINLSEGAGFLCLELSPKSKPLAMLCGGGIASDGYHMTAPDPNGLGSAYAMRQAIDRSGISTNDIDWVHTHGTGSTHNDAAEAKAIRAVFGEKDIAVSSSKAIHGHMLAASGTVESILCVMSLAKEVMLGTLNHITSDPDISLSVNDNTHSDPMNYVLKNTLGFGGSNGAVVFSKYGAR